MTIALSLGGLFVSAENGGDDAGVVSINRHAIGPWETFRVYQLGDGFVALETEKGRFLSHNPQGQLFANRARRSDTKARADLRNVPDDVVSLPHDAWESFNWSDLQHAFVVTVIEPDAPPEPPHQTVRHLRIDGRWFFDGTQRVFLNGTDQMRAYERFRNGEDLTPLFKESHDLGFEVWRVFLMATWTVHPDQDDLSQVRPFVDACNAHGIIPQLEVLADCQVLLPDRGAQQQRWIAICDRVRGASVLVSGGNEYDKNGFDPGALADPGPSILWSRGSATGDQPCFKPEGAFNCFHPRRDLPKMLDDSVASPNFLYGAYGLRGPLVMDEGIGFCPRNEPGRRSNDPDLARRLAGHYALEWSGAVYHNEAGMSSVPMDDQTRRCAEAWTGTITRVTGQI